MYRLFWMALLLSALASGQDADNATALLRKVEAVANSTKNWRAEVIRKSQLSGTGMDLEDEVHIKIAAQVPLKLRRENSGGDQTLLVCDGTESFYSGDGHSYYRTPAKANPDCDFPLNSFYQLRKDPVSVSMVGRDHVLLADGDRACEVLRAEWKLAALHLVRTMCVDPAWGLILRDVAENEGEKPGLRMVVKTTFTSYERNPTFSPDTFKFSIPSGAVEAKPPI